MEKVQRTLPSGFILNKEPKPQIKKLQNLYSWSEIYRSRGLVGKDDYEKVQEEIKEHKKKYNLK